MKHLLAITITLLPSAVLAQQFTPQQLIDVMTKSPSNRDVRVQDGVIPVQPDYRLYVISPGVEGEATDRLHQKWIISDSAKLPIY